MNIFTSLINKILIFEKEPQKIGLCHIDEKQVIPQKQPSIKNKDIKLSDLMRRVG